MSVGDSIKLGEVLLALAVGAVDEGSCGSTGCLSCRGKQSTSSSSSSGRSLLLFLIFVVAKVGGESVTGVGLEQGKAGMVDPTESSSMVSRGWVNKLSGKAVECFENTMVGGVVVYLVVAKRARKISTREYVEISEGARL